jgi:hypothetical protein
LTLGRAIELLEMRVLAGGIFEAQLEMNGALQAIHGLATGGLKRKGWTSDQRGIWEGLIGARNAAHHKGANVIAMWSERGEQRLRWQIDNALSIRSHSQRTEFIARLQGRPALPQLREIRSLLEHTVP